MINFLNVTFVLIFLLLADLIQAQPCGEHIDCETWKRPYGFCNGKGQIAYLCAEDPYNFNGRLFYEEFTIPLKMNSNALPLCLEFDNSGPDSVISQICGKRHCFTGIIYRKSDFLTDMNEAVNSWKCVCGWDENDCGCTVHIGFVDNNNAEFKDPEKEFASNTLDNQLSLGTIPGSFEINGNTPLNKDNCEISCSNIHIYLNNTEKFTGRTAEYPNYSPNHFFVSASICDSWTPDLYEGAIPGYSENLRNLITKQLGILYGMNSEIAGYVEECYRTGVMDNTNEPIIYDEMSKGDKCAFMALYCPGLMPVYDNCKTSNNNLNIYPNPSENSVTIKIKSTDNIFNTKLLLINNLGVVVKEIDIYEICEGENLIRIDNEGILPGTYTYTLKFNDEQLFGKVIILK